MAVYKGLHESSRTNSWGSSDIICHHYHRARLRLTLNSNGYMLSRVPFHGILITIMTRL